MSVFEIATIVLALAALVAGISWATLISTGKSVVKNARELRDKYNRAVADENITDAEKAAIATEAIELIEDVLDLWQQAVNIFCQLRKVIFRR